LILDSNALSAVADNVSAAVQVFLIQTRLRPRSLFSANLALESAITPARHVRAVA